MILSDSELNCNITTVVYIYIHIMEISRYSCKGSDFIYIYILLLTELIKTRPDETMRS